LRTTVAIPCYNEATTIAKVVSDFRKELPEAEILVVDNASSDDSGARAAAAGARVVREKRRGKGYVMQTILETVDADVCVIVDGDDTYFAEDVHQLLLPVTSDQADMVVGDRLKEASSVALNDLHRFGNRAILAIINMAFRTGFQDVLSGYRVMNRNFMDAVPLITGGFETELRNASALRLAEAVDAEQGDTVIVAGDLNAVLADDAIAPLTNLVTAPATGFELTYPTVFPVAQIDHVLARGATVTETRALPRTGSDHLPVVAYVDTPWS